MGAGRAFATPRGGGGRSAANPCARRSAAVRAVGSAALLRRCRGRGPFGASLSARPRPRLVSGRPARAPAAGAPCSGLAATHSPSPASGGFGTAPPPTPPRRSGRTAPRTDPPRRSGRTAYGPTPAGAADGPRRAERTDPTDRLPTATRGPRASAPTDRLPTACRPTNTDRGPNGRPAPPMLACSSLVARSFLARCALRAPRRGAQREPRRGGEGRSPAHSLGADGAHGPHGKGVQKNLPRCKALVGLLGRCN